LEAIKKKIDLHKLILERRNKAAAHSDWDYHQTKLVEVTNSGGVLRKNPVVIYREGIDIVLFRDIAETMEHHFRSEAYDRDIEHGK